MSESSKSFFDKFCNDYPNSDIAEGDKLPFDVGRSLLTEEEGECLNWCIQFLNTRQQAVAILHRLIIIFL